jgi:P-type E1-E2 ATPase
VPTVEGIHLLYLEINKIFSLSCQPICNSAGKTRFESQCFSQFSDRLGRRRKTPLYVAIDQKLAAIIAVADPIKESTFAAIEALHQLGLKVAMITGDNRHTAQAIAKTRY